MPDEKDDRIDEDLDNEELDGDDENSDDEDGDSEESGASEDGKKSEDSQDSDAAKYKKRMQAADRRAAAAEAKLREIENAGKTDSEKLQSERDEAVEWRSKNEPEMARLRLENAFLKTNELSWQNAGVAMSVARDGGYLEDVIDEETGDIDHKALKVALSKLARDHEYLVKRKRSTGGSGQGGSSGEPGPEGGKGTRNDSKQKQANLRRRLPALGTR